MARFPDVPEGDGGLISRRLTPARVFPPWVLIREPKGVYAGASGGSLMAKGRGTCAVFGSGWLIEAGRATSERMSLAKLNLARMHGHCRIAWINSHSPQR